MTNGYLRGNSPLRIFFPTVISLYGAYLGNNFPFPRLYFHYGNSPCLGLICAITHVVCVQFFFRYSNSPYLGLICAITYLPTVGKFDGSLAKEEIDEIPNFKGCHEIQHMSMRKKSIKSGMAHLKHCPYLTSGCVEGVSY